MKINELQSFWTKGKRSSSFKKPVPAGIELTSVSNGKTYKKVGGGWVIPTNDPTDPSNAGKPVDTVKAKQLDTEYWITQANKAQVQPQQKSMGFKISSLEPLVISYKGTDYILGDQGEWRTTKSPKAPSPQVADILDQIAGIEDTDVRQFVEPVTKFPVKYNNQVQDAFKTPKGVWFVGNKQMDPVQDKQIIAQLEKVSAK